MDPGAIEQAWAWLGREIVAFGFRWLVVGIVVLGFGGWLGKRYRDMKVQHRDMKVQHRGMKSRLSTLEAARAQPNQTINVNIGDAAKKISEEDPSHPVPKGRVAEYITDDKILRIGTKTGPMEIRLWDERKTVEDILRVLSKHVELKSLDDL